MKNGFKKKFLVVLMVLMWATPVFASAAYDAGMAAYNEGKYSLARSYFRSAIKSSYYDVNARYMLCQAYIKGDKNYAAAKSEYQRIIKIAPKSQAAAYAKQGIAQIDKYLAEQAAAKSKTTVAKTSTKTTQRVATNANQPKITATEYVKNAYRGGQKFTRERGTVRVYIENDPIYKPLMQKAYSEWQAAMGGSYVMFSYSGNRADAQDVVTFLKADSKAGLQEGGNCANRYNGTTITGANISLRTYSPDGKPLSKEWVYHAMLHEIGHSIGISGHSPYQGDVMAQGAKYPVAHLTQRDKNTARMLYQSYSRQPSAEEIRKAKEAELKDISKRMPNDIHSIVDLGDEYMAAGEYELAAQNYNKALKIKESTDLYYRLVKAYKNLNDRDQQVIAYKNILRLKPSEKSALSGLLMIYFDQRRIAEGRQILDNFIAKNPTMATDATIVSFKNMFSDKNMKRQEFIEKKYGAGRASKLQSKNTYQYDDGSSEE